MTCINNKQCYEDLINLFEAVVQGKAPSDNKSLSDYDPTKPTSSWMFGDINSLYPTLYIKKNQLPIFNDNGKEVENLIPENTPTDGKYCKMLSIDYYIPDDVKRVTDDLPMSVKQENYRWKMVSLLKYSNVWYQL